MCPARTTLRVRPGIGPWSSHATSFALRGTTILRSLSIPTRTIGCVRPIVGSSTL